MQTGSDLPIQSATERMLSDSVVAGVNLFDTSYCVTFGLLSAIFWVYVKRRELHVGIPILRVRRAYWWWLAAWVVVGGTWVWQYCFLLKDPGRDTAPHHSDIAYVLSDAASVFFGLFGVLTWHACNARPQSGWIRLAIALAGVQSVLGACCAELNQRFPDMQFARLHELTSLVLAVAAPVAVGLAMTHTLKSTAGFATSVAYAAMQIPGYIYLGAERSESAGPVALLSLHALGITKVGWAVLVSYHVHRLEVNGNLLRATIRLDKAHGWVFGLGVLLHVLATSFLMKHSPLDGFVKLYVTIASGALAIAYYGVGVFGRHVASTAENASQTKGQVDDARARSQSSEASSPVPVAAVAADQWYELRLENVAIASSKAVPCDVTLVVHHSTDVGSTHLAEFALHLSRRRNTSITPTPVVQFRLSPHTKNALELSACCTHNQLGASNSPVESSRVVIPLTSERVGDLAGNGVLRGHASDPISIRFRWLVCRVVTK